MKPNIEIPRQVHCCTINAKVAFYLEVLEEGRVTGVIAVI